MLQSIIDQLQSQLGHELQQKAGLSASQAKDILSETGKIATQEVKKEAISGGVDTLLNLFSNNANSKSANQLQSNITNSLTKTIMSKFGLSKDKAQLVSSLIIPALLKMITKENSKTPASDPSPLNTIFDMVLGGAGKGNTPKKKSGTQNNPLGDLLGKFLKK